MQEKFYLTKEFKKLNKSWQQKLKDSGFDEIEDIDPRFENKEPYFKCWHSHHFFKSYTPEEFEEKQTYYRQVAHFYWHYLEFKNRWEKEIWRLHGEGFSRRKIAQVLKPKYKITDSSVQIILSKLKKVMQTQKWPSSEMDDDERDYRKAIFNHLP